MRVVEVEALHNLGIGLSVTVTLNPKAPNLKPPQTLNPIAPNPKP